MHEPRGALALSFRIMSDNTPVRGKPETGMFPFSVNDVNSGELGPSLDEVMSVSSS
jgi:hypothetical protein